MLQLNLTDYRSKWLRKHIRSNVLLEPNIEQEQEPCKTPFDTT